MDGVQRIVKERKRQIEEKGYTLEHDKEYQCEELLLLAACYALKNYTFAEFEKEIEKELRAYWGSDYQPKYKNIIRDLERAGALIAAQIDIQLEREKELT